MKFFFSVWSFVKGNWEKKRKAPGGLDRKKGRKEGDTGTRVV